MDCTKIRDLVDAADVSEGDIRIERVRGRWLITIGDEPPALYLKGQRHTVTEIY